MDKAKQSSDTLDAATYETLAKPSQKVPVTYYSGVEPDLFDKIIAKYARNDAELARRARHRRNQRNRTSGLSSVD